MVGIAGYFCSGEKLFLSMDGFLYNYVSKLATTSSGYVVAGGMKGNGEWSGILLLLPMKCHHDSFDGFRDNASFNGKLWFM